MRQPIAAASLELLVVSCDAPRYWRAFAWVKLLKFWTSSRTDDLAGLLPESLALDVWGLSGTLRRAKTSGPGKKVKWLPIFVDAGASFTGADWLTTGFRIWKSADMDSQQSNGLGTRQAWYRNQLDQLMLSNVNPAPFIQG